MSVLCSLKNLNLTFGSKVIFDNASLVINQSEKIGLIGLNGKGKSSLFKILNGELSADNTSDFIFDKASEKLGLENTYSCFLVSQKFQMPDKEVSIRDYLFFIRKDLNSLKSSYDKALLDEDYDKQGILMEEMERVFYWDIINRYESSLKSFDLYNLDTPVHLLSGGEQRKILIALGLISEANMILWDEPTNHLDIESIKKLEDELISLKKTLVIISHDRHLLSKVCDRIVHISNGAIQSYKGSYADYLETLKQQEMDRINKLTRLKNSLRREQDWMNQGIKARGTRSKKRVEGFESLKSKVSDLKNQARSKIDLSLNNSQRKTKKLIELDAARVFIDDHILIDDFSCELYKGDKIGILGENGVGKSTLMNAICFDKFISYKKFYKAENLKINYFDQKIDHLDLSKTPFEYLGDGEDFVHFKNGTSIHVNAYFQKFLFDKAQVHRPLSSFSGGELKRLQLALNLKDESDVWIFDEPTNDLDIETIEILEDILSRFDGTLFLISHDRNFLENVTNKVWLIENKKLQQFQAGYSQVADYLDILIIEKNLSNESGAKLDLNSSHKQVDDHYISKNKPSSKKLSNKEKELLKKLPELIKKTESDLSETESLLEKFDYENIDQDNSMELSKLMAKKNELEQALLELYEKEQNN